MSERRWYKPHGSEAVLVGGPVFGFERAAPPKIDAAPRRGHSDTSTPAPEASNYDWLYWSREAPYQQDRPWARA